jgi:hypothetical protein
LINACVAEKFCDASPYVLTKVDGRFELRREDAAVAQCQVLRLPQWCSAETEGRKLGDILRPHSENVLSGMPNPRCHFFLTGEECGFCSLGPLQSAEPVMPELVAATAVHALKHNPQYELALSGGTPASPDRGVGYFAAVIRAIRTESTMPISVELVPPDDDSFIDELHDAGATSVIMNIEIWDPYLRSLFCPGKSGIPLDRYLAAIEYSVCVFGKGQVASVIIAGLQSNRMVVDAAKEVIDRDAIPTVIPFKPFDDCILSQLPGPHPLDLMEVNRAVSELLLARGLVPSMQRGCTGCGGCSLENVGCVPMGEVQ